MRFALLTFVMLAAPALAAPMTDEGQDAALLADHVAEVSTSQVDLLSGSIEGGAGTYTAVLRFADLAPEPSNTVQEFHAEAVFRTSEGGRVLASFTAQRDGDLFFIARASDHAFASMPVVGTYDALADEVTFTITSPYHTSDPYDAGARAALFECLGEAAHDVAGRGCSRAMLGPETGVSTAAIYDEMGFTEGNAFVRAGT